MAAIVHGDVDREIRAKGIPEPPVGSHYPRASARRSRT